VVFIGCCRERAVGSCKPIENAVRQQRSAVPPDTGTRDVRQRREGRTKRGIILQEPAGLDLVTIDLVLEHARILVVGERPNPLRRFLRPIYELWILKNLTAFGERGNREAIERYDDLFVSRGLCALFSRC